LSELVPGQPFNERNLLRLIAEGDESAFRQLFTHYNKRLFVFAEEIVKSAADAEEIIQDCFTKFWLKRTELHDIDNPGSYLYKMVRNKSLDYLRQTASHKRLINQVWANISQTQAQADDVFRSKEMTELVEQAIAELPLQKQKIYRLSRENEYSHEQIAALTGLSKSRVNNVIVEAIKHIKTSLEKHSSALALLFWITCWEKLF
jgi:RNA polymerase sigma-70 factor (family 1)